MRMREYAGHIGSLKAGQVGKLVPEEGETVRGLALRIGRAAPRRLNRVAETWVVDETDRRIRRLQATTASAMIEGNGRGTFIAHGTDSRVGTDAAFGVKITSNVPIVVQEV